jgi:hypothetical protein
LASEAEFDLAELAAGAGDVERNIHKVVLVGVGEDG